MQGIKKATRKLKTLCLGMFSSHNWECTHTHLEQDSHQNYRLFPCSLISSAEQAHIYAPKHSCSPAEIVLLPSLLLKLFSKLFNFKRCPQLNCLMNPNAQLRFLMVADKIEIQIIFETINDTITNLMICIILSMKINVHPEFKECVTELIKLLPPPAIVQNSFHLILLNVFPYLMTAFLF